MKCPNCHHEQETGKFCGKCGTALIAQTGEETASGTVPTQAATVSTAAAVNQRPAEPNQHVEKVKATSKQYGNYFVQYVKKPGSIVENPAGQLVNALITIGLFALIFSFAIYKNLSTVFSPVADLGSFFGSSPSMMPSIFSVVLGTVFTLGLTFALSAACIYLVNKFAGPDESFKNIITHFGTLMIPSLALVVVAFILLLINSMTFGNLLLFTSFSLAISVMPLYLITALLKKTVKALDSFYAYLSYIILFGVSFIILMTIFFDSTLGRYINEISNIF